MPPCRISPAQLHGYRRAVQRLFSMFPAGAAGWGLLLLRLCAAGMLIRISTLNATVPMPTWEIAAVAILVAAFCLWTVYPDNLLRLRCVADLHIATRTRA